MENRNDYQRAYSRWKAIKQRCYNPKNKSYKSYGARGVKLCDEWLDFKGFYKWYKENEYQIEGEYMAIDKDILGDGMLYSPETCLIIPFRINGLLVHKVDGDMRGLQKRGEMYEVKVRSVLSGKNEYIGTFKSVEQASKAYREAKNVIFQNVLDEYEGLIPEDVMDKLRDFKL